MYGSAKKGERYMADTTKIETTQNWYTWDKAAVGDKAPGEATVEITAEKILEYVECEDDTGRLYWDESFARQHGLEGLAVPIAMVCRVASNRRAEIMQAKGYEHPVRPTPFARWQCKTYAPMKVGDVITSTSKVGGKYERRGRHYLTWHVEGRNQQGEKVCEYDYTNLWDEGKPEDKKR